MCNALLTKPTETIVNKPVLNVPLPPATPDSHVLGMGAAQKAGARINQRRLQIDKAVAGAEGQ